MIISCEAQVENLIVGDVQFSELEKRLSQYCPFEALGVVKAEIRHSNFLASMLDPHRPHGLRERLLRRFLDEIITTIGGLPGLSRLELHLLEIVDVEIRREWHHIDLLILFPKKKIVLALELKIDSQESNGQLVRYREVIEHHWPTGGDTMPWSHILLFLTPDGQTPSDDLWIPVTYSNVINAIDEVFKNDEAGDPLARSMLRAYASMLRRELMDDTELKSLAQALWQRHSEALTFLMNERPDQVGGISQTVKAQASDVARAASINSLTLVPDDLTRGSTRFAIEQWDQLPDFRSASGYTSTRRLMLIEVQYYADQVRVVLMLGPGPAAVRELLFSAAQPEMKRGRQGLTNWKTLESDTILSRNQLSGMDQDLIIASITKGLHKFLENRITKFDVAFRNKFAGGVSGC